ncbi:hypothetical protein B9K01_12495, partial [Staphylococcus capitis]
MAKTQSVASVVTVVDVLGKHVAAGERTMMSKTVLTTLLSSVEREADVTVVKTQSVADEVN